MQLDLASSPTEKVAGRRFGCSSAVRREQVCKAPMRRVCAFLCGCIACVVVMSVCWLWCWVAREMRIWGRDSIAKRNKAAGV